MHILLGATKSREFVKLIKERGWGRIFVEYKPTPFPGESWAFDNGAYSWWRNGEVFNEDVYKKRLDKAYGVGKPCFAVVPDIVASKDSLEYSLNWMEKLPQDWPWYLVLQDGMVLEPKVIKPFKGLFLGGTDAFKSTAGKWRRFAHLNGKKFHYGRAGTFSKYCHAHEIGADSLDSSFPLWTRERFNAFLTFDRCIKEQGRLF